MAKSKSTKSAPKKAAEVEEVKTTPEEVTNEQPKTGESDTGSKTTDKKTTEAPAEKKSTDEPVAETDTVPAKDTVETEAVEAVAEEEAPVAEEPADEKETQVAEETPAVDPVRDGNYLNLPQELRDAEASQEQIHIPTGTRRTPPMNPFMKIQQERESKMVKANVPTAVDMNKLIADKLKVDVSNHFVLGSIVGKLNHYVTSMAPNTPVGEELGARWQGELAKCFFEALSATPEASIVALQIIELYFTEYRNHAFARSHAFRFMDLVRLEQQRLTAFQSLLHLFVELGNKDGRTKSEIQRQVNIRKIAESIPDNTDAQIRLVEFLN